MERETEHASRRAARRTLRAPWLLCATLLVLPRTAHADAGLPMLAVMWPLLWLAFVPIVLVEGLVARRLLRLDFRRSLSLSLVANFWSTLVGVPLTWVALLIPEVIVFAGLAGLTRDAPLKDSVFVALAPLMAPWIGPEPKPWHVYAAGAFLCVPFALASIWVEERVARRTLSPAEARSWARSANLATYGPGALILVILPLRAAFTAG